MTCTFGKERPRIRVPSPPGQGFHSSWDTMCQQFWDDGSTVRRVPDMRSTSLLTPVTFRRNWASSDGTEPRSTGRATGRATPPTP